MPKSVEPWGCGVGAVCVHLMGLYNSRPQLGGLRDLQRGLIFSLFLYLHLHLTGGLNLSPVSSQEQQWLAYTSVLLYCDTRTVGLIRGMSMSSTYFADNCDLISELDLSLDQLFYIVPDRIWILRSAKRNVSLTMLTTLTKNRFENKWHHNNSSIQTSIQYIYIHPFKQQQQQQQPYFSDTLILVEDYRQGSVDFSLSMRFPIGWYFAEEVTICMWKNQTFHPKITAK